MFERYTEKARRVVFFARYEASQFGSPYIETEHLLLGLLREDKSLTNRFLRSHASVESIRRQIEGHTTIREKVSSSVDLPLSNECKRVLAYAAEEAERLLHKHIGTEHLLLGLLREEKCFAAEILHERGLRLSTVREELARTSQEKAEQWRPLPESSPLFQFSRDLTQAAMDNQLEPVIGREAELDSIIEVLCSRKNNNPVLMGERGVGKTVIVEGLAQRIADGEVPSFLSYKHIMALDLSLITAGARFSGKSEERLNAIVKELGNSHDAILFISELHTLMGAASAEGAFDASDILKPVLSRGEIQCISETTPTEYPKTLQKIPWFGRCSRVVNVRPVSEVDAVKILFGIKERYEKFHAVTYTDDAITFSVAHSNLYLPDRYLPAKAIEVLDTAGSRVKLRQTSLPEDITEVQKRIKFIVHRMENAIANHEFEKARFYSDEERKERENLRALREKYHLDESSTGVVGREDIEEVISSWTGVSIASMREERTSADSSAADAPAVRRPGDQIFVSYSHKDKKWLERIETVLKPLTQDGKIDLWSDRKIKPGTQWQSEIEASLCSARVVILLVSQNFFAILESAKSKGIKILWIALNACLYGNSKVVNYQGVNDPSKPLDFFRGAALNRELVRIAETIKAAIEG